MSISQKLILLFLSFAIGLVPLLAQQPTLRFERLGSEQGLSQNYIQCLTQDQDGFLWIGTQDGVNRYDGHSFKSYTATMNKREGLPSSMIYSLTVTSSNQVWAGTHEGVARYDRKRDVFESMQKGSPWEDVEQGEFIYQIVDDAADGLWMATTHYGLVHWDGQTYTAYPIPEAEGTTEVLRIIVDAAGVWFNTRRDQLGFFNASTHEFSYTTPASSDGKQYPIFRLMAKTEGFIWGMVADGLLKYNPTTGETRFWSSEHDGTRLWNGADISSLKVDHWGKVWLASYRGLFSLDPETDQIYHYGNTGNAASLSDSHATALFTDMSDTLWVGTTSGLNRLGLGKPFRMYGSDPAVPGTLVYPYVYSIVEDREKRLWVSTLEGISRLDPGADHFINYRVSDDKGLSNNWVRSLYVDGQNQLWLGYEANGVGRWDPEQDRFINYPVSSGLRTSVLAILETKDHKLWLGTLGGLMLFDPTTQEYGKNLAVEGGTLARNCFALTYDSSDRLWAGFMNGLYLLEDGVLRQHLAGNGEVLAKTVLSILPMADGNLWIGCGEGLIYYEVAAKKARIFREEDGLANRLIYTVIADEQGMIWVSSNRGLSRIDPETDQIQNYRVSQGLQSEEFNSAAGLRRASGELVFGGVNGLNIFLPENLKSAHGHPPKLVLTDLLLLNKVVQPHPGEDSPLTEALNESKKLTIQPNSMLVSIEFSATHYARPQEVEYAWLLDGLEKHWVSTDANRRVATFTSLPPRDYVLRVKAGLDGEWGPERSIAIQVLPPFWRTPLAYLVYACLGMALIVGGYRLKSRKLRLEKSRVIQFNRELETQVRERTDQLAEARHGLLEEAHLAGMAEIAANVLHSIGNTLNSVQASAYVLTDQYSGKDVLIYVEHLKKLLEKEDEDLIAFFCDPERKAQLLDFVARLHRRLERDSQLVSQEGQRLHERLGEALKMLQDQQAHAMPRDQYLSKRSLNEIVKQTLDKQGLLFRDANLELALDLQPVPEVKLDETKIQRVLVYLFKNAKEAIETSKQRPGKVQVKTESLEREVCLKVIDNGCGLAQDTCRVFEMGYSTKTNGRGFGLHYCANAVAEMGGRIEVHSEGPNTGCIVALYFPR